MLRRGVCRQSRSENETTRGPMPLQVPLGRRGEVRSGQLDKLLRPVELPGLIMAVNVVQAVRSDLHDPCDHQTVRLSNPRNVPRRWLVVTKEAIAEYWLQQDWLPSELGLIVMSGVPDKGYGKLLSTFARSSKAKMMFLTDVSSAALRALIAAKGQLQDLRASFLGLNDGTLRAVGCPPNKALRDSSAFKMNEAERRDVGLALDENPEVEEMLGTYSTGLLRDGYALHVDQIFILSPGQHVLARRRLDALMKYRGTPLV